MQSVRDPPRVSRIAFGCGAAAVTMMLGACGGGGSPFVPGPIVADGPASPPAPTPTPTPPPPPSGAAAECFNPQLLAVGTTYQVDYQLSGSILGTTTDRVTVQAATGGPQDRLVTTDHRDDFVPPVPGGNTRVVQRREMQTADGLALVTTEDFTTYASGMVAHTVYQPPLRDRRFELLSPGASFLLVRNIAATPPYSFSSTVTYLGQETVTVPAGSYTACKFEEAQTGAGARWTWVIKGKGVVAKIQDETSGDSRALMATSRLNGEPI